MNPKHRIRWPVKGVSEDLGDEDQHPQTTPRAKNVRTVDGVSGRSQGAQRPGYSEALAAPVSSGAPVDAALSVTVDDSKIKLLGPNNSTLVETGTAQTPCGECATDVITDDDGNLYVVDGGGVFVKYGPDMEEVVRKTFYVFPLETVVPRIALDADGNVYVATTNDGGFSSVFMRFERLEDDEYDLAWKFEGTWGIRDFAVGGGIAAIARHYAEGDENRVADVLVLGQLYASEPTELHFSAVPNPISAIDLNSAGEVLFAAQANQDRLDNPISEESWQTPVVSWSPHELDDVGGTGASTRLHFWIDAETLSEVHVNGDEIPQVRDRRWLHTSLEEAAVKDGMVAPDGTATFIPPTDTTSRPAIQHKDYNFWRPKFQAKGAGSKPTIRFEGQKGYPPGRGWDSYNQGSQDFTGPEDTNLGNANPGWKHSHLIGSALWCGQKALNSGDKSDTDGDTFPDADGLMVAQRGPMVTHARAVFATFFMLRYQPRGDGGGVCFHHKASDGIEYALLFNVSRTTLYATGAPTFPLYTDATLETGKLVLFIGHGARWVRDGTNGVWSGVAPVAVGADDAGAGTAYQILECDLNDVDFKNDRQAVLICLQQAGAGVTGESLFRVNGRTVDRFTMTEVEAPAVRQGAVFGTTTDEHTDQSFTHMNAWKGDLMECVTVLGDTSTPTDPNTDPVTWPGQPAGAGAPANEGVALAYTDMQTQDYGLDPISYTNFASEIERMEGGLAYKWGVGDILPSIPSSPTTPAGGFQDSHPFGFTFAGTPQFPVGRTAAGGVVLSDTALALLSIKEIVGKIGSSGEVVWAIEGGGHGLGVASGPDGYLCAVGTHDAAANSTVVAKKVRDLGPTVRLDGDNTWQIESDSPPTDAPVTGLEMDERGSLYWPRSSELESLFLEFDDTTALGDGASSITITRSDGIADDLYTLVYAGSLTTSDDVRFDSPYSTWGDETMANNLAAAINDNGVLVDVPTIPEGPTSQYYIRPDGANPDVLATVVVEAGRVYLRLDRRSDAGDTTITLAGFTNPNPEAAFRHDPTPNIAEVLSPSSPNRLQLRDSETGDLLWDKVFGFAGDERPISVALDPILPLYPEDDEREGTPESLYVGMLSDGTEDAPTVRKYAQIERRQVIGADASPRRTIHVAAASGNLYLTPRGEAPVLAGNGTGAFNIGSPFVKLWVYRQKVYGLDGKNYIVYSPTRNRVEEWKAEGAGKIPFGAKLGNTWNQRQVLARTPDDPHNLHLSERGNPNGWDTAPSVLTPLSAFSGAGAGNLHFKLHDLVNCLIPARDDLLYIGGDRSFSRLTGDPGGQGQLDNISQLEGIAFGDAYAVGPAGEVFVKGINTGIWRLGVGGDIALITEGWIERRMQNIDLSVYDVVMSWSFRQKGLHVYVVPKSTGGRPVESYFWDAKHAAWWPDEFSSTSVQPTCTAIWDGDDPGDRALIMGTEDGRLLMEDELATNDGGERIESEVWLGPLVPSEAGAVLFTAVEAMLVGKTGYSGVDVDVFTGPIPDFLGGDEPVVSHHIGTGYQGDILFSALGNQVWIRLRNAARGEKWALQSLIVRARPAGARRM